MKKITLFAFVLISAMAISCSSDGDGGSVDSNVYFNYTADDAAIAVPAITALRVENNFEVMAQNADGRSMYLNFKKSGQLIRATSTSSNDDPFNWKNSGYDFSKDSFNFEIVAIDESAKIIKCNYSGKLFEDAYDQANSAFANVSGSFNVHYTEMAPNIADLGTNAKIGGNDWKSVKTGLTNNGDMDNVEVYTNSDDAYSISIFVNLFETTTGTYNFTGASTNNKVTLSKYDTTTDSYVNYTCTGTFDLDAITDDGFGDYLIQGTFSFTAVNPNDSSTIQVTNGTFKEYFNW
ncbi:MAG TPA: hypothetical protein VK623_03575 [Flavobacterium sp.]|nr:hypothetical protein [Flavobacterium sp.]